MLIQIKKKAKIFPETKRGEIMEVKFLKWQRKKKSQEGGNKNEKNNLSGNEKQKSLKKNTITASLNNAENKKRNDQ